MDTSSIITRIITGILYLKIDGEIYRYTAPTLEQRALADMIFREIFQETKFNDLITRDQAKQILARKGRWTNEHEDNYKKMSKHIEDLKINLYKSLYNNKQQATIRRQLVGYNKSLEKSIAQKYELDNLTLEYHAENTRDDFLTAICIVDNQGGPVYTYDNFWQKDSYILNRFSTLLSQNPVTTEQYRKMARTDPFRSMWSIGKHDMFSIPATQLSLEQRNIVMYCSMYAGVYDHPERPVDEVLEDDDMLDGWLILQRRQVDKDRNDREVEKLLGKKGADQNADGGELFIVTNSAEEARKIRNMNDLDGQRRIKQRTKAVEEKGTLHEHHLPDVKLDLRTQAMRQAADKLKGKGK